MINGMESGLHWMIALHDSIIDKGVGFVTLNMSLFLSEVCRLLLLKDVKKLTLMLTPSRRHNLEATCL